MPDSDHIPDGWTLRNKFAVVMETASMNQAEIAAYCREKGTCVIAIDMALRMIGQTLL